MEEKCHMSSTLSLLQRFVIDKLVSYKEPQRRGIPKGAKIGFSKVKYQAALNFLYDTRSSSPLTEGKGLAALAEALGISHDALRHWRGEEDFRNLATFLHVEFSDQFVDFVKSAYKQLLAKWAHRRKQSMRSIARAADYPSVVAELQQNISDASIYSPGLKLFILKRLESDIRRANKNGDVAMLEFVSLVIGFLDVVNKEEYRAQTERELRIIAESLLDRLEKMLSKPRLRLGERKEALAALNFLKLEFARRFKREEKS
jgi:hypothetical protein